MKQDGFPAYSSNQYTPREFPTQVPAAHPQLLYGRVFPCDPLTDVVQGNLIGILFSNPDKTEDISMVSFIDWFIPALIGVQFTLLGSLKLYGLSRGVVGGADKPFVTRLCGT